jgi:hypothetical protein
MNDIEAIPYTQYCSVLQFIAGMFNNLGYDTWVIGKDIIGVKR